MKYKLIKVLIAIVLCAGILTACQREDEGNVSDTSEKPTSYVCVTQYANDGTVINQYEKQGVVRSVYTNNGGYTYFHTSTGYTYLSGTIKIESNKCK